MDIAADEWTAEGLLDEIKTNDANMEDRSLAFILGAGTSVASGIPSGGALAQRWLKEIHKRENLRAGDDLEAWAASKLSASGFRLTDAATHYAKIFELRFGRDPQSGYAALQAEMEKAEPSLGYSILARLLGTTRHKVVVTTNFDNLVADALAIHALQHPLIVGHEALAGFVRPRLPRPLVAKIHRDLHLNPKNDQNGVDTLEKGWEDALRSLFQHYTPLVIGYGGNDGSLMGLLERLESGFIPGRLFWCYREGDRPGRRILGVVARHRGVIVAVAGFDEFMVQLAKKLTPDFQLDDIAKEIRNIGEERAKRYQAQADKLLESLAKASPGSHSPTADQARQSISEVTQDENKWWTWELRARSEANIDKQDAIYLAALAQLPGSAELTGNYAIFLANQRKDYDAAEAMYRKALELDPNDANNSANMAWLLISRGKDENLPEARQLIHRVAELSQGVASQTLAEALLYDALLARPTANQDDDPCIARLKSLISLGFERGTWDFSPVFAATLPKIAADEHAFFRALGEAILDADKVKLLEDYPQWHNAQPADPFFLD
jgi:tetratricopeptide (TPR) repeat protein